MSDNKIEVPNSVLIDVPYKQEEYYLLHYLKDKGAPIEGTTSPRWRDGLEIKSWWNPARHSYTYMWIKEL
jgi:hypothetical protein